MHTKLSHRTKPGTVARPLNWHQNTRKYAESPGVPKLLPPGKGQIIRFIVVRSCLGTSGPSALDTKRKTASSFETRAAPAHDFTLTHELGFEFGTVQCQIDVEVHAVESPLRRVHSFEVLFKVLL